MNSQSGSLQAMRTGHGRRRKVYLNSENVEAFFGASRRFFFFGSDEQLRMSDSRDFRQPVLFLSHGGGPSFFMDAKQYPSMAGMDKNSEAAQFLRELARTHLPSRPKAVLVVSAHWEEKVPTVMDDKKHMLYYDYYGFPDTTYKLKWSASGSPRVANRVAELLESKGITCNSVQERGLDHGVFVPLILVWPDADVPVLQLSLKNSLNVAEHQEIGEALSDLGKEGILVIGSGFMTHTFEKMGQLTEDIFPWASEFQRWVHEVFCDPQLTPRERKERMSDCESLPFFKKAHPRTEHFMPLIMASAAAEYTPGKPIFSRFVSPSLLMEHIIFRPHSL